MYSKMSKKVIPQALLDIEINEDRNPKDSSSRN